MVVLFDCLLGDLVTNQPPQGSLNKMLGQHPLRARAKDLDKGIMTIRLVTYYLLLTATND
jgi:hypothetical protein